MTRTAHRTARHHEVVRQRLCARRRQPSRRRGRGRRTDRRQRRRQVDADQDPRRASVKPTSGEILVRGKRSSRLERGALARRRHRDRVPGPRARGAADRSCATSSWAASSTGRLGLLDPGRERARGRAADARDRLHLEGVLAATRSSASFRAASGRASRSRAPSTTRRT